MFCVDLDFLKQVYTYPALRQGCLGSTEKVRQCLGLCFAVSFAGENTSFIFGQQNICFEFCYEQGKKDGGYHSNRANVFIKMRKTALFVKIQFFCSSYAPELSLRRAITQESIQGYVRHDPW